MTGRVTDLSPSIPAEHRENIRNLAERIYKDTTQNTTALRLTAQEADEVLGDINKAIERINAALQGTAWSEAYRALVTMRDVVCNVAVHPVFSHQSIYVKGT